MINTIKNLFPTWDKGESFVHNIFYSAGHLVFLIVGLICVFVLPMIGITALSGFFQNASDTLRGGAMELINGCDIRWGSDLYVEAVLMNILTGLLAYCAISWSKYYRWGIGAKIAFWVLLICICANISVNFCDVGVADGKDSQRFVYILFITPGLIGGWLYWRRKHIDKSVSS